MIVKSGKSRTAMAVDCQDNGLWGGESEHCEMNEIYD